MEQGRFRRVKADTETIPSDIGTKTPSADGLVHLLRLPGGTQRDERWITDESECVIPQKD